MDVLTKVGCVLPLLWQIARRFELLVQSRVVARSDSVRSHFCIATHQRWCRRLSYLQRPLDSTAGLLAETEEANRLPAPIEATIVHLKREYPGWGAPKIREKLRQQYTSPYLPAISTIHAVLDRHGLVHHRRRRRSGASGTELSRPSQANAL